MRFVFLPFPFSSFLTFYLLSSSDLAFLSLLQTQMGLGKTVQSVSFLNYLFHERQQYGPFLVVVPLSTIPAWQQQFKYWAPDMNVICYMGKRDSRQVIRQYEFGSAKKLKFNVLLTTYEFILKDRNDLGGIKWQALEVDEVSFWSLLLREGWSAGVGRWGTSESFPD